MAEFTPRFSSQAERLAQPGSDVWKVHYDAQARQQAGEDILILSVGDPDFDTPEYIAEACGRPDARWAHPLFSCCRRRWSA